MKKFKVAIRKIGVIVVGTRNDIGINTALVYASFNCHHDGVKKLLLNHGTDENVKYIKNKTALY